MNTDPVVIKEIQWTKIFPALHLFKAFGLAFRLRVLVPAMLCVVLCDAGWMVAESFDIEPSYQAKKEAAYPSYPKPDSVRDWTTGWLGESVWGASGLLVENAARLPRPLRMTNHILDDVKFPKSSWVVPWLFLAGGIVVCSFGLLLVGSPTAARFCQGRRIGPVSGLKYGIRMVPNLCVALALVLIMICVVKLGLNVSAWLGERIGFVRPVVWLAALIQFPLKYGLLVAAALATAGIATDRCDGAESLSRGINYCLSHLVRVAAYLVAVLFISRVAYLVMWNLVRCAHSFVPKGYGNPSGQSYGHEPVVTLGDYLFVVLPDAVHLAAFFSGVTLMYILLRKREDAVSLDEMRALD